MTGIYDMSVNGGCFFGLHEKRIQKKKEFQMCGIPPLKMSFGGNADHRATKCDLSHLLQKNTASKSNKERGLQSLKKKKIKS